MRFTKMHGLGNDFIVVDDRAEAPIDWAALARRVCERHTGIGADGILVVQPSRVADLRMRLFNADGSEAEMCGNGIRCTALLAAASGWGGERIAWETGAGRVVTELRGDRVTVDMGPPRFRAADVPVIADTEEVVDAPMRVGDRDLRITCVGMGNPHCVVVVDDVDAAPVAELGPMLERHPRFPERTNVEFVQVMSSTGVRQRTWERGVGETNACGTGACASAVALRRLGRVGGSVEVALRGGDLHIDWEPGGVVWMTGPAVAVFSGELELQGSERLAVSPAS
jgi:diaminopimelate epimerase